MRTIVLPVLASAAVALAACSNTEVVPPTMNVSVGQQLMDLKHARDNGALSDDDYQRQKKQIIDNVR